jgi:hypothetical protein
LGDFHIMADDIADTVRRIVVQYQAARRRVERREQGRIDFVQPVQVVTASGQELVLLSRDISPTGIRLIGTCRLLGQLVTIRVPLGTGHASFQARILWTCPVGDDLVENGGTFLSSSTPG